MSIESLLLLNIQLNVFFFGENVLTISIFISYRS